MLVQLDPKDYEVAVTNARAMMANQQASAEASRINVPLTSVNTSTQLSSAHADVENARAGLIAAQQQLAGGRSVAAGGRSQRSEGPGRRRALQATGSEGRDPPTTVLAGACEPESNGGGRRSGPRVGGSGGTGGDAGAHALAQAQAALLYAETRPQQISAQSPAPTAARAQVQQAAAALEQAQLNLQYATIVAPVSGIVGQRSVQPGQYLSPGQQLLSIVPLDTPNIWVTANFKETQLKEMRPGQPARIAVDTYGREYRRSRGQHRRRQRCAIQPAAAGKRHGQLRESGSADPGQDSVR